MSTGICRIPARMLECCRGYLEAASLRYHDKLRLHSTLKMRGWEEKKREERIVVVEVVDYEWPHQSPVAVPRVTNTLLPRG
jgi:hypothetical protein